MRQALALPSPFNVQTIPDMDLQFAALAVGLFGPHVSLWRDLQDKAIRHVMKSLEAIDKAIIAQMDPHVHAVSKNKRPAVMAAMAVVLRWPDHMLPKDFIEGFKVVGETPPSGVFRDLFINQMNLLDRAVKMAAEADEPLDQNYVRKHAMEQAEEMGVSVREAATRVFSNAAGSYSANVGLAIENGGWESESQLQEQFVGRKGFAFNADKPGMMTQSTDMFKAALSTVDVTFQNLDSSEISISPEMPTSRAARTLAATSASKGRGRRLGDQV